jgi:hypothetical protein
VNTVKRKEIISPLLFLIIIFVSFSVSPAFTNSKNGMNLLLIGVMGFSPIIIAYYMRFYRSDVWLILFIISLILFPLAVHPDTVRWSTIMYTAMYGLTFLAYKQLLYISKFTVVDYRKLLKYLIFSYFLVLIIQQFCVLTGLPIFSLSNYDLNNPWKLNSLTSEPSHSARILALLMYCHILAVELIKKRPYTFRLDFKDDKWVWLSFLWVMVTMGSGTAFLFIAIFLLKFIKFGNIFPLFITLGVIVFFVDMLDLTAYERTLNTFVATLSFDKDVIIEADHGAAFRIVPIMILAGMIDLSILNGWFGYGVDHVASFLSYYMPGLPDGQTGGGLLQVLIDYGFISFVLFLIFNFSNCFRKGDYLSVVFWITLAFMQSINSQILWLTIIALLTNKYFQREEKVQSK